MYTSSGARGARYEWLNLTQSIGTPLYIAVQVFRPFHGPMFSSNACKLLDCPTFLYIPHKHVLFSLALLKSLLTIQNLNTYGTVTQIVMLLPLAVQVF